MRVDMLVFYLFIYLFIYLLLESGEGGRKGGKETSISCLSHSPNPNGSQAGTQPTEPHQLEHASFVFDLRESFQSFASKYVSCEFFTDALYQVKEVPFYS